MMARWSGIFLAGCIAWYTINIARNAWAQGNKGGATLVFFVALIAFVLPTLTLLFGT